MTSLIQRITARQAEAAAMARLLKNPRKLSVALQTGLNQLLTSIPEQDRAALNSIGLTEKILKADPQQVNTNALTWNLTEQFSPTELDLSDCRLAYISSDCTITLSFPREWVFEGAPMRISLLIWHHLLPEDEQTLRDIGVIREETEITPDRKCTVVSCEI
jgi:hypothetical protein